MCFICLAEQIQGKTFVVELAENSCVQSPFRSEFHSVFLAARMQLKNSAGILLDRANQYPSSAPQAPRNACQRSWNTALAFSILHIAEE